MVQYPATAFDPFTAPATRAINTLRLRDHVAIEGVVTDLIIRYWVGGVPALHVTITDESGSFTGAFLGCTRVAGVALGETIILGGTVMLRRGRPLFMNPHLWLTGRDRAVESEVGRVLAHA